MNHDPANIETLFDDLSSAARRRRVEQQLDTQRLHRLDRAATRRRHAVAALYLLAMMVVPATLAARDINPDVHTSSLRGQARSLALANQIVAAL